MNDSEQTCRSDGRVSLEQFRAAAKAVGSPPDGPGLIFRRDDVDQASYEFLSRFGTVGCGALLLGVLIGRELYGVSEDERRLIEDFRASTR